MPSLECTPAIKIAMYRVGGRLRWHWVDTGGVLACQAEVGGLQCVRNIPASEVEADIKLDCPHTCQKCRDALIGRGLIRSIAQMNADEKAGRQAGDTTGAYKP